MKYKIGDKVRFGPDAVNAGRTGYVMHCYIRARSQDKYVYLVQVSNGHYVYVAERYLIPFKIKTNREILCPPEGGSLSTLVNE